MKRENFNSRLGFILVSAGCAIGIGNVWKFPYVTGVSAGACNAVDYVSGQIGRTKACVITEDKNNSYIGLKQTLKNKTLFDNLCFLPRTLYISLFF